MKPAERYQQGSASDFLFKLKKKFFFYYIIYWISKHRMGGYFLKTCFLNR